MQQTGGSYNIKGIWIMKAARIGVCLLPFVSSGLLSSCTLTHQHNMAIEKAQGDMTKLNIGMTKAEVWSSIGKPGGRYFQGGNEIWAYHYNMFGKVYAGTRSTMACLAVAFDGHRTVRWYEECPPEASMVKKI